MTTAPPRAGTLADPFKDRVRDHYERLAPERDGWYRKNGYYHDFVESRLRDLIPPGSSVLELGCCTGNLLAALKPARGLGLDLSPAAVEIARGKYPQLEFRVGDAEAIDLEETFDYVVASDLLGELGDIASMLDGIRKVAHAETRLVLTFHSPSLELALRLAQRSGAAMAPARQNWIGMETARELLELADYEVEHEEHGLLVPILLPLGAQINRALSNRGAFKYLSLVNLLVARPVPIEPPAPLSCTVVIPCRNEVGNIEPAIERMPELGRHTEVIFVDGSSTDGTKEKIEEVIARFRDTRDIKLILQVPQADYSQAKDHPGTPTLMLKLGKGDAVRKGFEMGSGEVLMILDADLTVPPEDLPRFFAPLAAGKARFVNGTRLVYPMEAQAMKFVNYLGNWFFSRLFTWLLEQPIRDTLCGTKALLKSDYERIKDGRAHFGDFDPFGDFDLLFGAARLKLPIVEVPVRYRRRIAGVSKVRVSRHGWLLVAMSVIAFRRLKLAKWLARGRR